MNIEKAWVIFKSFFFGTEKVDKHPESSFEYKINKEAQHIFESLKRLEIYNANYRIKAKVIDQLPEAHQEFFNKFAELIKKGDLSEIEWSKHIKEGFEKLESSDQRLFLQELRYIWKKYAPEGLLKMDQLPLADPKTHEEGLAYDNLTLKGDKLFGVEPGFESVKHWTERDTAKLDNPKHKFHHLALQICKEEGITVIDEDLPIEDYFKDVPGAKLTEILTEAELKTVIDEIMKREQKFTKSHFVKLTYDEAEFGRKWSKADTQKLDEVGSDYHQFAKDFLNKRYEISYDDDVYNLKDLNGNPIPLSKIIPLIGKEEAEGEKLYNEIKAGIIGKFWKTYLPLERAVKKFGLIPGKIYQQSTGETARDKNYSAITEALANDIYTALNFGGQKLTLRVSEYKTGYPKLLLDGTEVVGPKDAVVLDYKTKKVEQDGKIVKIKTDEPITFKTLEGKIKKGRLEGNAIYHEGKAYPLNTKHLAGYLIKALLMGDRDKIGSNGANVGFVLVNNEAIIMNIDPGKAMPGAPSRDDTQIGGKTDLMTYENLHSDFSFDQVETTYKDRKAKGYKNFTIFSDTKLSEKMRGMREIVERWDEIKSIFDKYTAFFNRHDPSDPLDFGKELKETFERLEGRKEYFEEVFKERLQMVIVNEAGNTVQDDEMLDLLDNFEKLTSPTTNRAGRKSDGVILNHLNIKKHRKEWFPILDKDPLSKRKTIGLRFVDSHNKANKVIQSIYRYCIYRDFDPTKYISWNSLPQGRLEVRLDFSSLEPKELKSFMDIFSEENIAEYKNQPLYKQNVEEAA